MIPRRVLLYLWVALCACVTACDVGPAPTPTPAPPGVPVTLQGQGEQTSAPIPLAAGTWSLAWTAARLDTGDATPCAVRGNLRAVTAGAVGFGDFYGVGPTGTTTLPGVVAGVYVLQLYPGACHWVVTLTPLP